MKVYCIDCKYLRSYVEDMDEAVCGHPDFIVVESNENHYTKFETYKYKLCKDINMNNDCSRFVDMIEYDRKRYRDEMEEKCNKLDLPWYKKFINGIRRKK